jgi:hypothetical protein
MTATDARELRGVFTRPSRGPAKGRRCVDRALRLDGTYCRDRDPRERASQRMVRARKGTCRTLADLRVRTRLTFDPAAWGQGFATEAARCIRDYARDVLRLSYAVSAILPQNTRSRRVAERSGAQRDGQMDVTGRSLTATCGRSRLAVRPGSSRRPRNRRLPAIPR